jgi:hypothetical protein
MAFTVPDDLRGPFSPFITFFDASGAIRPQYLPYWRDTYGVVALVFGLFHLFLSLWMFLEYFVINWPNFKLPRLYYTFITRYINVTNKVFTTEYTMKCLSDNFMYKCVVYQARTTVNIL